MLRKTETEGKRLDASVSVRIYQDDGWHGNLRGWMELATRRSCVNGGDVVKCKRKFVVDMNKRMPCIVMTTAGSYFSEK